MIDFEVIQKRLLNNQLIVINFKGHKLLLDASGALVWPAKDLLIFSDLHLEKGSFLSQFANPLPRFDTADTLKRMRQIMDIYTCSTVVSLGDSLHDGNAIKRMQKEDLANLNAMVESVDEFVWILGNHDPDIPKEILGKRVAHLRVSDLCLVHEPLDLHSFNDSSALQTHCNAQIVGHFHPKCKHTLARRQVSGKCYLVADDILFMPAFGKYTGGLASDDKAFSPFISHKTVQTYLIYNKKIFLL